MQMVSQCPAKTQPGCCAISRITCCQMLSRTSLSNICLNVLAVAISMRNWISCGDSPVDMLATDRHNKMNPCDDPSQEKRAIV